MRNATRQYTCTIFEKGKETFWQLLELSQQNHWKFGNELVRQKVGEKDFWALLQ